jgi:hypothetical protein
MLGLIPQLEQSTVQSLLAIYSEIADVLTFEDSVKFIELVQILKPTITLSLLPDEAGPPDHLRIPIHEFLSKALHLKHDVTKIVWHALSPLAWDLEGDENNLHAFGQHHIQSFLDYGIPLGIGEESLVFLSPTLSFITNIAFYHFMPCTKHCLDPGCTTNRKSAATGNLFRRELTERLSLPVTVFTQDFGPIPGISTSLYCQG